MTRQFKALVSTGFKVVPIPGRLVQSFLALVLTMLYAATALAIQVPAAGSPIRLQTNGAAAPLGNGDWYSSGDVDGGQGYHYVEFYVPVGWPSGEPVYVDLLSPEMNCNIPELDEVNPDGLRSDTQFELYDTGTAYSPYATPAPGATGSLSSITYPPIETCPNTSDWIRAFTLSSPVTAGTYLLRVASIPSSGQSSSDDQNAWAFRFGRDNDSDPTNTPPSNTDDFDGTAGTGDELGVGILQMSYQYNIVEPQCVDQYQLVSGDPSSITLHNFDMDGNSTVTYYGPDGTSFPGTVSGNETWNNGTASTRGGDTITTGDYGQSLDGVWRSETCFEENNQIIQEMQGGLPTLIGGSESPEIVLTKDDGITEVGAGQLVSYTIGFTNSGDGSAVNNVLTDTLPANSSFISCSIAAPYNGSGSSCSHAAGVVTYVLVPDIIPAGGSGSVTLNVRVDPDYPGGDFTNTANISYDQLWGLGTLTASATDTDTFAVFNTDVSIFKTASPDPVESGQTLTYTLFVTNNGPGIAPNVVINDTLPSEVTWVSTTPSAGGSCSIPSGVTCEFNYLLPNASATVTIVVTVN